MANVRCSDRNRRYIPTIGRPDWDIHTCTQTERDAILNRLVLGQLHRMEDYQRVITYMYKCYPYEMDGLKTPETGKANVAIQWRFQAGKNAVNVQNRVAGREQSMYAFVLYDPVRDMEPVGFAGSYFTLGHRYSEDDQNRFYCCDRDGNINPDGECQMYGNGIVMFIAPEYRRMNLATYLWLAEAELYRSALHVRYQKEIQNTYSLQSTMRMFDKPEKCLVLSQGRRKQDGTYGQIRCLLDYTDQSLIDNFDAMPANLKSIHGEPHAGWVEREETADLQAVWDAGKLL